MPWPTTSRHQRGYGRQWEKLRMQVLKRDERLCQVCFKAGRIKLATEVDHVVPKGKGGTDSLANLQAICGPCHSAKTLLDSGRSTKPRIGLNGWRIE